VAHLALVQSRERVAALIFLSAGFEVGNLLLDLGDTGDEVMGDGVDDLVSYHGESVLEAVEATAGKRLLFADRTSNAPLLFGDKSLGRISHVRSPYDFGRFPRRIRLVNPDKCGREPGRQSPTGTGGQDSVRSDRARRSRRLDPEVSCAADST
jgi:hypothetical protein